jgi:hypothetical protein
MMIEERMDRVDRTLEFVAALQRTNEQDISKLVDQSQENSRGIAALKEHEVVIDRQMEILAQRMTVLTERTIQAMDSINCLGRTAENHQGRIEDSEGPRPS